jgi:lipopolysaccharide/colanic/teichoic acid biosynthesis glycosyltransferase
MVLLKNSNDLDRLYKKAKRQVIFLTVTYYGLIIICVVGLITIIALLIRNPQWF